MSLRIREEPPTLTLNNTNLPTLSRISEGLKLPAAIRALRGFFFYQYMFLRISNSGKANDGN
jgi:hypothetical protein